MVRLLTANFVILVLAVLDCSHIHGGLVRKDLPTRDKIGITSIKNGVQHALVKEEVAHPLRDDNIYLRKGKLNLLHLALEEGDPV